MMMKHLSIFLLALVASVLLASGTAWSGIIVTVGKTSTVSTDNRTPNTNTTGTSSLRPVGEPGEGSRDDMTGDAWGDPTVVPAGCVPLGGGLVYCDSDRPTKKGGAGSGVGASEGGGLDDTDETWQGESIETLGCAAGEAGPGLWLGVLSLLGFGFIARRRMLRARR